MLEVIRKEGNGAGGGTGFRSSLPGRGGVQSESTAGTQPPLALKGEVP